MSLRHDARIPGPSDKSLSSWRLRVTFLAGLAALDIQCVACLVGFCEFTYPDRAANPYERTVKYHDDEHEGGANGNHPAGERSRNVCLRSCRAV